MFKSFIFIFSFFIATFANGQTTWVAHKGTWKDFIFPQNSKESLHRAIEKGFKGLEFDVQATKDGVFVLGHDDGLTRISNCEGKISESVFAKIKDCIIDYSATWTVTQIARKKVAYPTKITTMEEALDLILSDERVTFVWVDFKIMNLDHVSSVVKILSKFTTVQRAKILFNNGSLEFLEILRKGLPDLKTSYEEKLGGEALRNPDFYFSKKGSHIDMIGIGVGLALGHEPIWKVIGRRSRMFKMLDSFMPRAREEGVPVIFWTESKVKRLKNLIKFKPDYILTDLPFLPEI